MTTGRENLPDLVDSFGRTADAEFDFGTLMDFLTDRLGRVDEAEVYDLIRGSSYIFEAWKTASQMSFLPRRMFFQGAEFRIVPTQEEVEGGFLFPGHHFMPFVSREVFPADFWLVLPDGSAPHVRRINLPVQSAMESLSFFGERETSEYLVSDDPANESAEGSVSVTAYDLRDFYAENSFKPGDALMVRVLDWLQGVFAISPAPEEAHASASELAGWTAALRSAYDRMQIELGTEGDCYEQLAIMLLLAQEDALFPVMKTPPLPLSAFIREQDDIVVGSRDDHSIFCTPEEDVFMEEYEDLRGPLDLIFQELGILLSEADIGAYMRDALFQGLEDPNAVLARVFDGQSLIFKSADDQEDFHMFWYELWEDVVAIYSPSNDPFGETRSKLLELNDRCCAILRKFDVQNLAPEELEKDLILKDFNQLAPLVPSMLALLNINDLIPHPPLESLGKILPPLFDQLPAILEKLEGR